MDTSLKIALMASVRDVTFLNSSMGIITACGSPRLVMTNRSPFRVIRSVIWSKCVRAAVIDTVLGSIFFAFCPIVYFGWGIISMR